MEQALLDCIIPLFYGAMPNMGLYCQPDGPFANPADLLPTGEIEEARDGAAGDGREHAAQDMLYVAATHGRGGRRRHQLRHHRLGRRRRVPRHPAGGRGAGRHDRPRHRGRHGGRVRARLPRRARVRGHAPGRPLAAPAGQGGGGRPARTSSAPWSTPTPAGRRPGTSPAPCTFVKECSRVATIPVHANVGMGVGGVPIVRGAAERRRSPGPASRWSRSAGPTGCRWAGRSLRDVALPRAGLGHGRHPDDRRSGRPDAAPQR